MIRPTKKPVTKTELMAKYGVSYNGLEPYLKARGYKLKNTRKYQETGKRGRPSALYLMVPA